MALGKAKKKDRATEPVATDISDIRVQAAAPPTPNSAPRQKRGIYRRETQTIRIESSADLQRVKAQWESALDPMPHLAEIERVCRAVVEAAIERNRPIIEAALSKQRDLIDDIGRLTIKRAKELHVEPLRRQPEERERRKVAFSFEHWQAQTLRGFNGSATTPFVPDADDQERDAHQALLDLNRLREAREAGKIDAVMSLSLRLGRTIERFNVRPFEPLVEVTLNKRDGVRRDRDRRHGTPEDQATLAHRLRCAVDALRDEDIRANKKPRSMHKCCQTLAAQKTFKQPNGKPYGHDALRKMCGPVRNRLD